MVGNGLRPLGLATEDATEAAEAVEVLLGRNRWEGLATEGERGLTFIGGLAATLVAEAAERVRWRGGICNSEAADSKLVAVEETGREAIEARGVVSAALDADAGAPRASEGFGLAVFVLVLVAVVREEAVEEAVEEGVGGGAAAFRRLVGVAAFERTEGATDLGLGEAGLVAVTRRGVPVPVPVLGTGEAGGPEDEDVESSRVSRVSERRRVVVEGPTGEFGFLLGEDEPLVPLPLAGLRRGVGGAGTSRVGGGRRGAEVDAVAFVATLLVESAFDFERFRLSTLARIEVMLATSISGSSRSLDNSAANPARVRVFGPRVTPGASSGGETRSFSFSISRSGRESTVMTDNAMQTHSTHPVLFLGGPIAPDYQSHRPVEPAPSASATSVEFPLVCLLPVVAQQSRCPKTRTWDR